MSQPGTGNGRSETAMPEPAVPGLVTVYVPTHNRVGMLERALLSALAQTDQTLEVLVVSDGSTDGTDAMMAEQCQLHDSVRYLRLPKPRGACAARNHAIRHARGQFVTGLDDDDAITHDHIAKLRAAYAPQLALVAPSQQVVYSHRSVPNTADAGLVTLKSLLHYNKLGNQVFTERDRILAVGGFDEQLPAFQDYDLWVRLVARYGAAKKTTDVTYQVHVDHELERISASSARRREGLQRFIDKHRALMTPAHLRSMELLTLKHSGERLPLRTAARLLRRGNEKAVLSLFVNTRLPWVQRAYHRLASLRRQ